MNASTEHPTSVGGPPSRRRLGGTTVAGLVLVTIGAVLLLDRAGVVDAGAVLRDGWPLIAVVLGARWIVDGSRPTGVVTAVLGLLLLGVNLEVLPGRSSALVGPAILVIVGTGLVTTARSLARAPAVRVATPSDLTVGATSVFGDTRLFLSDDTGGGADAAVTTTAVFGDVHVEVPAGWRVEDRTTSFLGTVRIPRRQPTYAEAPLVTLYGTAIFGDVRARYLDATEVE